MKSLLRFSALALAFALCAISVRAQETNNLQESDSVNERRVEFPVTLSDGNTYVISGNFYCRGSLRNQTLQVLVHGGTYNHKYWNAPTINGHSYSYVNYMAENGYALLAIDQLGDGLSSKPDGDFVTMAETTSSLHQILVQLRSRANPLRHAFDTIVLVGHSLGSINAIYVQATYHDANALVVTGLGHVPHPLPISPELIAQLAQYPYFRLPSEARSQLFYYASAADPDVISYDNSSFADLLTRGQLLTSFAAIFHPEADRVGEVTGPALVQLGENDGWWPAQFAGGEAAYWTSTSVTVQSLPNVGHDFNTHLDNKTGWCWIDRWIRDLGLCHQ